MSKEPKTSDVTKIQVGGDHYKNMAIQPTEFIAKNNIPFIEGNIIKYATRHKHKNKAEDLKKVIHYAQLALHYYYPEEEK